MLSIADAWEHWWLTSNAIYCWWEHWWLTSTLATADGRIDDLLATLSTTDGSIDDLLAMLSTADRNVDNLQAMLSLMTLPLLSTTTDEGIDESLRWWLLGIQRDYIIGWYWHRPTQRRYAALKRFGRISGLCSSVLKNAAQWLLVQEIHQNTSTPFVTSF